MEKTANNEYNLVNRFYTGFNSASDINIDSETMYISAFSDGLLIYDLSDPVNPELISQINDYWPGRSLVQHSVLYVLMNQNIFLYDVSNPAQPNLISNLFFSFNSNELYTLNQKALYGYEQQGYSGPQHITAYDINDPENPSWCASLQTCPNWECSWPDAMESDESELFMAVNDTIKIFDISDTDSINFKTQFTVPGNICYLLFEDTLLHVAVQNSGIYLYDVSDSFQPELKGFYEQAAYFEDIDVSSDHIFSSLGKDGFKIADKTDLQNIVDVYEFNQTDAVYSSLIDSSLAYFGMWASGLQIVDITDLLNPIRLGNISNLPYIRRIESFSNFLYCEQYNHDTVIHIIDISDPGNPSKAGVLSSEHSGIYDYCIDGEKLYVLDSFHYVQTYDLSIPTSPVLLSEYKEWVTCLAVRDTIMVLGKNDTHAWEGKINLFSISIDSTVLLDSITLGDYHTHRAFQLEINFPFVYVRVNAGLIVLKIENNKLEFCDEIIGGNISNYMTYDDEYIYMSTPYEGEYQILAIDYTDPYNLTVEHIIDKSSHYLEPFGKNLCIPIGNAGYYFYGRDFVGTDPLPAVKKEIEILCYPNPCKQQTTFEFSNPENKDVKLTVYNLSGKKIREINIAHSKQFTLDTRAFSEGVYLCKFSDGNFSVTHKLVVSR
ncbi:MAG: T9SS type A sorting domain-containing protein [Bacteroidales bacterium]|nr:T9SS type A sorting domain-containing protein [Bacteroidales bacterium]